MTQITGGCLCGAIRITATGQPDRVGICHCLDCQKHHGAAFYAAAVFKADHVTISGDSNHYQGRHVCPTCGSSVFAVTDDEVELHLGALDEPGLLTPQYELWIKRRQPWLAPITGAAQYREGREADG